MKSLSIAPTPESLDQLLNEVDTLKYTNNARVITLTQQILEYAQQMGDYRAFTSALAHQAWANALLNRPGDSLTSAMESLVLARNYNYSDIEAHALNTIGYIFGICGLWHEANILFEHQIQITSLIKHNELLALAMNNRGLALLTNQDIEGALDLLEQAAMIVPHDSHRGLDRANVLSSLAIVLCAVGRLQEAQETGKEMLRVAHAAGSPQNIVAAEVTMTHICLRVGDIQSATEHLNHALIYANEPDHTLTNQIKIEMVRGNLLAAQGRDVEAVYALERAYDFSTTANRIDMAVRSLNYIKTIHERRGDLPAIVAIYRRLNEDVVLQQQEHGNLRLKVLAMVFAQNKAAIQEEINLTQQKYTMLQRLSHEFRTPLAIIKSAADLVDNQGEEMSLPQRQNHLRSISGQVKGMTLMLENITHLLGEEDTTPEVINARQFSVGTVVFLALRRLERDEFPVTRIHAKVQPEIQAAIVPADAYETVIYHLATNALKYSADDVYIDVWADQNDLILRVMDTGIGIPETDQHFVFQPMIRGSNMAQADGAGLGLAIVNKLVNQMNGSIELKSTEGQGTSIMVHLPMPEAMLTIPEWRIETPKAPGKTKKGARAPKKSL